MKDEYKFFSAGDNGIICHVGREISESVNKKVRGLTHIINTSTVDFSEIIEMIPAYTSVLVIYDPLKTTYVDLVTKLKGLMNQLIDTPLPLAKIIHVPVVYGGVYGEDIVTVAEHNQLSVEEVINIHSSMEYLIYMIGFTPGFPYLGGMNEGIATPRLLVPRQKIPAGSVGIAGNQTGIYPIESPGGWQLIGRTPIDLFDPKRRPAVLFSAGDYIKFDPIRDEEYKEIKRAVENNEYEIKVSQRKGSDIDV